MFSQINWPINVTFFVYKTYQSLQVQPSESSLPGRVFKLIFLSSYLMIIEENRSKSAYMIPYKRRAKRSIEASLRHFKIGY
jgi:hypothetical protein